MNDRARQMAGVTWTSLEHGATAYALHGDERGPKVVLVHGTSSPSFVWAPTVEHLVEAGFRVLTYDLYGRGFSDRPAVRYDLDLYVGQLHQLLQHVGWSEAVRVVGWSLGGVIAAAWAAGHPGMCYPGVAMIAPGGFGVRIPLAARLLMFPVVGDLLLATVGRKVLAESWRKGFVEPDRWDDFGWRFQEQLAYEGVERAVLSTLRSVKISDQSVLWRKLAEQGRPVLLIWGKQDATCPATGVDVARTFFADLTVLEIDGAGHAVHQERPLDVGEALVTFLRG
jgi:pimeloyl-ACP methyl ester carboxylesterase